MIWTSWCVYMLKRTVKSTLLVPLLFKGRRRLFGISISHKLIKFHHLPRYQLLVFKFLSCETVVAKGTQYLSFSNDAFLNCINNISFKLAVHFRQTTLLFPSPRSDKHTAAAERHFASTIFFVSTIAILQRVYIYMQCIYCYIFQLGLNCPQM